MQFTQKSLKKNNNLYAPPQVFPSPRWVRVSFGGEIIADSKQVLFLQQYGPDRLPTYYFPPQDVRREVLQTETPDQNPPEAQYWTVKAGQKIARHAAWTLTSPLPPLTDLKGYITFEWKAMDAWYEEAEEIFVHAPDPYKRVDVRASDRHIRVEIGGETVAETRRPYLLFETSLPTRYYIPQEDVRMDALEPSHLKSQCPFKGIASYWSVNSLKNVAWSYPEPIPECPKIKNLVCFFNEWVDIYVDGVLEERPISPWS